MLKKLLVLILLSFTSTAFAIFCPNNFQTINIGDPLQQILQQCGQPNLQNNFKKDEVVSEEWSYFVKRNVNDAATSKMLVTFKSDRVINIHLENNSAINPAVCTSTLQVTNDQKVVNTVCNNANQPSDVASTAICGSIIKIGSTTQEVQAACGQATSAHKTAQSSASSGPATEITELRYDTPTAPVTLIFENGLLKEKR